MLAVSQAAHRFYSSNLISDCSYLTLIYVSLESRYIALSRHS